MGEKKLQFVNAFWLLFVAARIVVGDDTAGLPKDAVEGSGAGYKVDGMTLLPEQIAMMQSSRKAVNHQLYRWSKSNGYPEIPYRFADALVNRAKVKQAIAKWEQHTCVKFLEVDDSTSKYHLILQHHDKDCMTFAGYVGWYFTSWSGQAFNVSTWCEDEMRSLVQKFGNAIGLLIEQMRKDRDSYIKVHLDNINPSYAREYNKQNDNNYDVPYDYMSIMNLNDTLYSLNGHLTFATLNPLYQGVVGKGVGVSHMDSLIVNKMYDCISLNLAACYMSADPCQNYGFLGKSCSCVCPEGTSGENCETKTTDYKDVHLSSYSEIITSPGTVSTPNHPSTTPGGESFTKWIQAPVCKLIQLTFADFNASPRSNSTGVPMCHFEGLEIRTTDLYDGDWYCGTEITSGQIFTSTTNQMILYFRAMDGASPARWSAAVTFIRDPSPACPNITEPLNTPAPKCPSKYMGNRQKAFYSPNYPSEYPNNTVCVHESHKKRPYQAVLSISQQLGDGDKIVIEHPYGRAFTLKGTKKDYTMKVPVYFRATFTSNGFKNDMGFKILYKQKQGKCHMTVDGCTPGFVTSPFYPNKHSDRSMCEWKITVSPGKRVRLVIHLKKVYCRWNYLAVDNTPYDTMSYVPSDIKKYCGTKKVIMISNSSVVSIFYYGRFESNGVRVYYSEVA